MKSLKKVLLLFVLVIFSGNILTACASSSADNATSSQQKVKIGVTATYIPWCYQKDGVLQGYEIDVWNEIASRSGFEVEFVPAKFSGLFGMLDAGQIDSIGQQISITTEREEKYDFSEPYAYSSYSFIVKEDSTYNDVQDLKDKKVGVGLGGNGERTLRALNEEYGLNLEIVTFDGAASSLNDVNLDRLDASWMGTVAADVSIEESGFPLRTFDPGYVSEINAYPFKKGSDAELLEKTNTALSSMREDGTLKKLSEKWFNRDITEN